MMEELRVDNNGLLDLKEIFDYIFRGTGKEVTSLLTHQATIKEERKDSISYHCYNYNSYSMPYVIYKLIPEALEIGSITIKIQDYNSLIGIYLKEIRKRLSTEESAEPAPKNVENYEEAIGV